MVGHVMTRKIFRYLQKILGNATLMGMAVLSVIPEAYGQGLPDPTRPPAGFVDAQDVKAGGDAVRGGDNAGGLNNPDGPRLELQSVLLPQNGKPVAVISGHYLPLGGKIDQWELKSVSEHEVVLGQGKERRVLKLTPQVRKTMHKVSVATVAKKPVRTQRAKKSKIRKAS